MISEEKEKEIKALEAIYPDRESLILPLLHVIQEEKGFISDEAISYIAERVGVSRSRVLGTMSFYTYFSREPRGKYHIQVCRNLSCSLMGAESVIDCIKRELGIKEGETTGDGKFTLSLVECLGCCDKGPVMMINDEYYTELTPEKIKEILKELK